jgi:hypothetical protein
MPMVWSYILAGRLGPQETGGSGEKRCEPPMAACDIPRRHADGGKLDL